MMSVKWRKGARLTGRTLRFILCLTFCTQGFSPSVKIRGLSAGGTESARPFLLASSASVSRGPESVDTNRRFWSETAVGQEEEKEDDGKCSTKSARSRSWRCSLGVCICIVWAVARAQRHEERGWMFMRMCVLIVGA